MSGPGGAESESGAEWLKCDPERYRIPAALRPIRDRVLEGARLSPAQRVLDLGAGTGLLALEARRRVGPAGAVVALDVSREALRTARQRMDSGAPDSPLHFVVGTATRLPLASESFDAVVVRAVLQFVPDKAAAAREFLRVLRPGGRVSLFEPLNWAARGNAC